MGNKRLPLKRRDLQTLSGSEFLNDEIINKYLTLILERNDADASLPEIYTCTTFMYTPTGIPTHTESWIKEDLRRILRKSSLIQLSVCVGIPVGVYIKVVQVYISGKLASASFLSSISVRYLFIISSFKNSDPLRVWRSLRFRGNRLFPM